MTYYPVPSVRTHDSWPATHQNKYAKGNFQANPPEAVVAKGDLFLGSRLHALARVPVGVNNQTLITDLSQAGGRKWNDSGLVPIGGIVIWSGSVVGIPSGWQLCDGTGGTPDLRNRFILGGNGSDTGTTGGAASLNLQHAHGSVTGTSTGSHLHNVPAAGSADGAHSHSVSIGDSSSGPMVAQVATAAANRTHSHSVSASSDSNGSHIHNYSNTGSDGLHSHTCSPTGNALSATTNTLPPYYALCYIMRMS